MIGRWLTASEAKINTQIAQAIVNQPELIKIEGYLDLLMSFQGRNQNAQSINVTSGNFTMPLNAANYLQSAFGYELTHQNTATPPNGTGQWVKLLTVSWENQMIGETRRVFLTQDVANAHATPNTLLDVTGLQFPVKAGKGYQFRVMIPYTSANVNTGSRWTINGPAATMAYRSIYPLTASTFTTNFLSAYNQPAACNATSLLINTAEIVGMISPSVDGTVVVLFASEVTLSAITAKAGAMLEYTRVL